MPNTVPLQPGDIVSFRDQNWRILHVEDFERVLATRVSDQRHDFLPIAELGLPVWDGTATSKDFQGKPSDEVGTAGIPTSRNAQRLLKRKIRQFTGELTEEQKKLLDNAIKEFKSILVILKTPRQVRGPLVNELCKKFDISTATAYRHIALVRLHGSPEAILPAIRADRGRYRLKSEVLGIIRDHLCDHRFIETPKTLPDIRVLINGMLKKEGYKNISLSALRNIEQETTLKEKLLLQGRKKIVKDKFGSKVGKLPDNDYPLAIVQVDHTPTQVCLVDELNRQPIGDAWLTLVIDTYSRMVLGFFLTFDPPSTLSTGMALAHAFLPKEDFLRSVGVSGEWPCWGFPDIVHVDNAAELNGRMMHGARRLYRFDLRDRPVGSPNFGGHVESAFKTFMYEFKSLPGTKFSNPMERGEYDSEGKAIFTIAEFEAFFTEFLVNDYHLRKHRGKEMDRLTPLQKWKKGIFEGDSMPPTGLPERPADPIALRISLLPFNMRTIRNGVVDIFTENYHNPALTLIGDSINLEKPLSERLYEVRYDPRDISQLWLLNPTTGDYLDIHFTDLRKGSISLWEHNARKKRLGDPSAQFADQRYESKQRREEIKITSARRTKQQRLANEKERRRAEGSLVKPPPSPNSRSAVSAHKKPLDPERLKALRDKVRPAAVDPSIIKEKPDDT